MSKTRSAKLLATVLLLVTVAALTSCMPAPPRQRAVAAAVSQIGVRYQYGASQPGVAMDCSGLTSWAWSQGGLRIPRTAAAQYTATQRISKSQLQPGDLVFWGSGGRVTHVAMYVGGGQIVQARKPGTVVERLSVDWWASNRIGYGHIRI